MRTLTLLLALLLVGAVPAYADQDPAGDARQAQCGTNTYVYAFVTTNSMVPAENAVISGMSVTVGAPIESDTCELNSWLQTLTAESNWRISVDGVVLASASHSESISSDLCETVSDSPTYTIGDLVFHGQHQATVTNTATGWASQDCPGGTSVTMSHNHSFTN